MTAIDVKALYARIRADSITRVADRHRQIAETLDGLAKQVHELGEPGRVRATDLAARVVHEIAWISANGNPERVVRMAADYDRNVPAASPKD